MSADKLSTDFAAARRVSTPIVIVTTADQWATLDRLAAVIKNGKTIGDPTKGDDAIITHDCIHGMRTYPGNVGGDAARAKLGLEQDKTINPVAVLTVAEERLTKGSTLFLVNAHRHFVDMPTRMIQAVHNVRDAFKMDHRMVVLLCPSMQVPKELDGDVLTFDEPLPTREQRGVIIDRQHENAKLEKPSKEVRERVIDALSSMPTFKAEQNTAIALRSSGINVEVVQEETRKTINATDGLSVWIGDESFENIGGLGNIKNYFRQYLSGPNRPSGIVFIDEIEKDTAGMKGDNTGVSQRQHKSLLTHMQDKKARGVILAGQSGAGKSAIAKAVGNEAGIPVIVLNLGDMLDSHVGASETLMRNALKTIDEVCQGRSLFIATCNDLKGISAELRARFKNGTFYFDLPTNEERDRIWSIYLKRYNFAPNSKRPSDDGWVGREIEACCDQAHSLGVSLVEAAQYIVPQAVALRDVVESRRREAHGNIISASYPGVYQIGTKETATAGSAAGRRSIDMG